MSATRVFGSEHLGATAKSHAALPTPLVLDDDLMRVYVSARDEVGHSLPYAIDVALPSLQIVGTADGPILDVGDRGCFDENGIMPSSAVRLDDGSVRLYYIGWNRGSDSVPYRLSIGSARSLDGTTFERESRGPLLDRSRHDPIFVTAPCVQRLADGEWSMTYVSTSSWDVIDGRPEPRYHLASARSPDGLSWQPEGALRIGLAAEAFGRPSRLSFGSDDLLACCHRGMRGYRQPGSTAYRLALLRHSVDDVWNAVDDNLVVAGDDPWASEMRCYPQLVAADGRLLMLYNGDGFGRSGVLAAWIDPEDLAVAV